MQVVVKIIVAWLSVAAFAAAACPQKLPERIILVNGTELTLEIAVSQEERHCGLSGRNTLEENRGMLFVLPRKMPVAFWMDETPLPLSIAFLDGKGKIVSIQEMVPGRYQLYESPGSVRYAIEVNRGWFAERNVTVGDAVALPGDERKESRTEN